MHVRLGGRLLNLALQQALLLALLGLQSPALQAHGEQALEALHPHLRHDLLRIRGLLGLGLVELLLQLQELLLHVPLLFQLVHGSFPLVQRSPEQVRRLLLRTPGEHALDCGDLPLLRDDQLLLDVRQLFLEAIPGGGHALLALRLASPSQEDRLQEGCLLAVGHAPDEGSRSQLHSGGEALESVLDLFEVPRGLFGQLRGRHEPPYSLLGAPPPTGVAVLDRGHLFGGLDHGALQQRLHHGRVLGGLADLLRGRALVRPVEGPPHDSDLLREHLQGLRDGLELVFCDLRHLLHDVADNRLLVYCQELLLHRQRHAVELEDVKGCRQGLPAVPVLGYPGLHHPEVPVIEELLNLKPLHRADVPRRRRSRRSPRE
mmetsp:Transcript_41051/g.103086  ORF Transcript_41051/g.103086 Transcript_41051/m.103086 type:complete len:374 (-) Transcript_41051:1107-2228(-)